MIDICAERGWLVSVVRIQQLMQCLVQGRWYDDSPVLSLPFVEELNIPFFKRIPVKWVRIENNFCEFCIFIYNLNPFFYYPIFQFSNRDSILTLPTLKESVFQNYEKLAKPLREDFEEGQIERIYKVDFLSLNNFFGLWWKQIFSMHFLRFYVICQPLRLNYVLLAK